MDKKQENYDNYYIYDDPIPYISENSRKYREVIENEVNLIQSIPNLNDDNKIKLEKLKKEYDSHILFINPVTMKDYLRFYISINCLLIEKNKIPDPNIIRMSYLDFLFYMAENTPNGSFYLFMLCDLLNLCCGIEEERIQYIKDDNNKINLILGVKQEDQSYIDIVLNKKDFDNIKNIILHQNMPDYDDSYIDPKVEQALKEADEFINRHKKKMCSLEDQLICVLISTSLNMEQIKNLTIRKFTKILQRVDFKLHYEIYKTASMSGFVSFKEEIDHWMSEISNDKYSNAILDYSQFKNKMEHVTK